VRLRRRLTGLERLRFSASSGTLDRRRGGGWFASRRSGRRNRRVDWGAGGGSAARRGPVIGRGHFAGACRGTAATGSAATGHHGIAAARPAARPAAGHHSVADCGVAAGDAASGVVTTEPTAEPAPQPGADAATAADPAAVGGDAQLARRPRLDGYGVALRVAAAGAGDADATAAAGIGVNEKIATVQLARRDGIGVGKAENQGLVSEIALPLFDAAEILAVSGIRLAGLGQDAGALAVPDQQILRTGDALVAARHQTHAKRRLFLVLPRHGGGRHRDGGAMGGRRENRPSQKNYCRGAAKRVEHDPAAYTRRKRLANLASGAGTARLQLRRQLPAGDSDAAEPGPWIASSCLRCMRGTTRPQMICAACQQPNRAGRKFCSECGAALALQCASCGAANEPGEKFCGECGAPTLPPDTSATSPRTTTPTQQAADQSETRKVISIIFADLMGSTALQERLDPESVNRVMDAYYQAVRGPVEAAGRHGGAAARRRRAVRLRHPADRRGRRLAGGARRGGNPAGVP
jgi:hypothetical protein